MQVAEGPLMTGFNDIHLVHQAVPELEIEEIDISVEFLGKRLECPIIINAITGGSELGRKINRDLAWLAARHGLGMAVGSQTIALDEPVWRDSFAAARKANPSGLLIANTGADAGLSRACEAVAMIEADALQVHLNVPQEMAMAEGDRSFRGLLANISELTAQLGVPVIAKEVGFGLSRESALRLFDVGVRIFDNGGSGGTNFIRIEDKRAGMFMGELDDWGIPTAASLAEVLSLKLPARIIASGGIRSAHDIVKAIAMGADLCGIAGWFLRVLLEQDRSCLDRLIEGMIYRIKAALLMCGARNWNELKQKPLVILGETRSWLQARGVKFADRGSV